MSNRSVQENDNTLTAVEQAAEEREVAVAELELELRPLPVVGDNGYFGISGQDHRPPGCPLIPAGVRQTHPADRQHRSSGYP